MIDIHNYQLNFYYNFNDNHIYIISIGIIYLKLLFMLKY